MAHRGYVAQLEELHLGSDLALAWSCQLQHSIASQAEVRQVSTGLTGTATPQLVELGPCPVYSQPEVTSSTCCAWRSPPGSLQSAHGPRSGLVFCPGDCGKLFNSSLVSGE